METLRVGRASGEAEADPDPSWSGLYRAGGVSAVLFVVLTIASIVLAFITPQPQSSGGSLMLPGGVATLQFIASHRSVFILDQLLFVGPVVLTMVVFLALYVALKHLSKGYAAIGAAVGIAGVVLSLVPFSLVGGLVYLSDQYVAVTTVAQRADFATAAESLIAQNNSVSAGGILFTAGVLVISLAMVKGVFQKGIAYLGIVTGVVGIICEALRPILGPGYSIYLILLIWISAVGWKLYRLGASSSHARVAKQLEAQAAP
jgi:Domain of unknown function (DUF4386)